MEYGICPLSIAPMRAEPADPAEMVNQILFGELFEVIDQNEKWVRVSLAHDKYKGWIDKKQILPIGQAEYQKLLKKKPVYSASPVDILQGNDEQSHLMILQGSPLPGYAPGKPLRFGGQVFSAPEDIVKVPGHKAELVNWAYSYLNAPYLWGGRSPFGIDCSALTQMVYRMIGQNIPRDSGQQAGIGESLSFIEEAEPGDLAFFDDTEGKIIHVGILLRDNHIIHASGQVRVDRLDQTGIYNNELRSHTHHLRVIKKII